MDAELSLDSPVEWAERQWSASRLGDVRRTARAVRFGAALAARSDQSMPRQLDSWAELRGAYRLLSSPGVSHESLTRAHREGTLRAASAPNQGLILFVQDQTELNFGSRAKNRGLGFAGNTFTYGLQVHSALCVLPGRTPSVLGLAFQKVWTRDHPPRKKIETAKERSERATEYDNWEETVRLLGRAPEADSGTSWVSVGDQASDVYAHLEAALSLGWHVLVRSRHDRVLQVVEPEAEEETSKLRGYVRSLPEGASFALSLRARPGRAAREVRLSVSWSPVALRRPRGGGVLELWAVRAWEEDPPAGEEALEWILLTSLAIQSVQDALEAVELYRRRWLVEEYHKCLKTGCRMEESQLATKDRLTALLGLKAVVAVRLLQLKASDPLEPEASELVEVVRRVTGAKEDLSEPRSLLRRIARMGGFLARKGDGEPGWQTIWHGWNRLQDIMLGWQAAREAKDNAPKWPLPP